MFMPGSNCDASKIVDGLKKAEKAEIDLSAATLDASKINKLAEVLGHAGCPPIYLNLRQASAERITPVLDAALKNRVLTGLDLSCFTLRGASGGMVMLQAEHLQKVAGMLGEGSQLSELHLQGQVLGSRPCSLEKERLIFTDQRRADRTRAFRQIISAVQGCSSMRTLDLRNSSLFGDDLQLIGHLLFQQNDLPKLTTLMMSSAEWGAADIKAFLPRINSDVLETLVIDGVADEDYRDELVGVLARVNTLCDVSTTTSAGWRHLVDDNPVQAILQQISSNRDHRAQTIRTVALCLSERQADLVPPDVYRLLEAKLRETERHQRLTEVHGATG
jgi:uncharacterized protein YjbI with pentapeptide repeats